MSDGIPKSRVMLTYDTKQPEGREKPRELPFRLMVMGDVGGDKQEVPFEQRKVRQLNGRNLGEVIKGLKIKISNVAIGDQARGDAEKVDLVVDSLSSFTPDEVLRVLTGQKAREGRVDSVLASTWGTNKPAEIWPGSAKLAERWEKREDVVGFMKSFQNSKVLRAALKRFSAPPADEKEAAERKAALQELRSSLAKQLSTPPEEK
jgi:hypothetical protein